MNVAAARSHFPGLLGKTFLDSACVSLASRCAVEAVEKFLDVTMRCPLDSATEHHIFMDEMRSAARPAIANLIHARQDEIALVENTTHALALAADAIPLQNGDRVLISDLEFMQVAIPWLQKQSQGVKVDIVPSRGGEVLAQDFAERITPRTRVICVSTVQWTNGYRLDLAAFSRLCRERDIWLVVDAIQQLGAIPLNLGQTQVDILACGGHKWLNTPFGCGFLYISREALPRLRAPLAGYLAVEDPPGGWGEYFRNPATTPLTDYSFVKSARRFETGGTANYPGAVGLTASLKLLDQFGRGDIAEHIFELTDQLIAGLDQLGIEVVTPRSRENRSGIVTFSVGSAEDNIRVAEYLQKKKILVSVRYTTGVGGVRVSCHYFNSSEDIDRLLWEVKSSKS